MRRANPQGKGVVPVLDDWLSRRPGFASVRSPSLWLRDLFLSRLVLSAEFRFRPVVGQRYYLYLRNGRWSLTLIAPKEWSEDRSAQCLGICELQQDMTWVVEPLAGEGEGPDRSVMETVAQLADGFIEEVAASDGAPELLPGYVASLPYHRRMLACALDTSLRDSLRRSGLEVARPARWLESDLRAFDGLLTGPGPAR